MESKKDNRVTRYHDEIVNNMSNRIADYNRRANECTSQAVTLYAQVKILEDQMLAISQLLDKGNYENGTSKESG